MLWLIIWNSTFRWEIGQFYTFIFIEKKMAHMKNLHKGKIIDA